MRRLVLADPAVPVVLRRPGGRSDVSVVAFDASCLRGKCDEDPALGYALMQRVAQVMYRRLQAARVRLLDLYGADVPADLRHARRRPSAIRLPRPFRVAQPPARRTTPGP